MKNYHLKILIVNKKYAELNIMENINTAIVAYR
jgi:hypothetical protein